MGECVFFRKLVKEEIDKAPGVANLHCRLDWIQLHLETPLNEPVETCGELN